MKVLVEITRTAAREPDDYLRRVLQEMRDKGNVQLTQLDDPALVLDVEIKVINP